MAGRAGKGMAIVGAAITGAGAAINPQAIQFNQPSTAALRADITTNLVARYTCEDAAGADSSGNSHTMTWSNSPTVVTGKIGNALSLNGTNQRGSCAMPFANANTLAAWVKLAALPTNQAMIAGWSNNNEPTGQYSTVLGIDASGHVLGYAYDGVTRRAASTATLSIGTWTHVAATFADGSGITVYVNGSADGTAALSTQYSAWSDGPIIKIGGSTTGTGTAAFPSFANIAIDDLRIYSRALSSGDATQLARFPPKSTYYWYLNSRLKPCAKYFLAAQVSTTPAQTR